MDTARRRPGWARVYDPESKKTEYVNLRHARSLAIEHERRFLAWRGWIVASFDYGDVVIDERFTTRADAEQALEELIAVLNDEDLHAAA